MTHRVWARWRRFRRRKLTLLAVPFDGGNTKRWVISYGQILVAVAITIVCLTFALAAVGLVHIQKAQIARLNSELLTSNERCTSLHLEIAEQDKQLQDLIRRIRTMESQVTAMNYVSLEIYEVLKQMGISIDELPELEKSAPVLAENGTKAANRQGEAESEQTNIEEYSGQGGPDSGKNSVKQVLNAIGRLEEYIPQQVDALQQAREALVEELVQLEHTPSIWPNDGWVSSNYGWRKDPFTGKDAFHEGIDIANHRGSPIAATAAGTVTYAGSMSGYGNVVIIDHGQGIETRYGHIDKILVERGEKVEKGQIIATMGNTGRSTGPHLHYEVRINGQPVSPYQYLPTR